MALDKWLSHADTCNVAVYGDLNLEDRTSLQRHWWCARLRDRRRGPLDPDKEHLREGHRKFWGYEIDVDESARMQALMVRGGAWWINLARSKNELGHKGAGMWISLARLRTHQGQPDIVS